MEYLYTYVNTLQWTQAESQPIKAIIVFSQIRQYLSPRAWFAFWATLMAFLVTNSSNALIYSKTKWIYIADPGPTSQPGAFSNNECSREYEISKLFSACNEELLDLPSN